MRVTAEAVPRWWCGSYPYYQKGKGVTVKYEQATPTHVQRTFTRSDIVKTVQINGWRKPSAYISDEVTDILPLVTHVTQYVDGGLFHGFSNSYFGSAYSDDWKIPASRVPDTAVWNSLFYAAVARAKDETINIAVTCAELGETISLVRGRSKLFGELFDLAKAKRWDDILRHLNLKNYSFKKGKDDVAGRWMELWFGWLPILSDVYGAIDLVGRKARGEGLTVVARATRVTSSIAESFQGNPVWRRSYGKYVAGFLNDKVGVSTQFLLSNSEGYKVSLWFTVDNPKLQLASSLGLTDPASVAWELTKLSWFVDFFVDIGNWLAALDTLGLTFKGGSQSWWSLQSSEAKSISWSSTTGGVNQTTSGGDGLKSRKQSERRVVTGTPAPFYLKNPFSTWKAITTSALVAQKFK